MSSKMYIGDAQHLSDLRIVLMGYNGAGKSSSGNTILGRDEFGLKRSAQCVRRHGEVADRHITVIEAPGWRSNHTVENSSELLKQEILLSVSLCPPGPHAVLLIIPVGDRFKETRRKSLQDHLDLLGERVWSHTIVLFSNGDSLLDTSIEQYIESEGQDLQWLVDKCGNRYHVLNNHNRSDDTQIKEMLEKIEETLVENNGHHFEMDDRKEAEERLDKWREDIRLQTMSGADGSDSWSVGSSGYGSFRSRSGAESGFSSSRSRDSSHKSYESGPGAIKRYNSKEWLPSNRADPIFGSSRSRDPSYKSYLSGGIKQYNSKEWPPPNLSGDEQSDTRSVRSSASGSFRSLSEAHRDSSSSSSSRSKVSSHSSCLRFVCGTFRNQTNTCFAQDPNTFPKKIKEA